MRSPFVVVAMVTAALPPLLHAQEVPHPDAGTVFVFSQGRVERFVRGEGNMQVWATLRGREYRRHSNPATPILEWQVGDRSGTRRLVGNVDAVWPPRTGSKTRFRVLSETIDGNDRRRSVQLWRCEVLAMAPIATPAGRFETIPLRCLRYSANTMRPLQTRTWYWSPAVGHYVRRVTENMRSGETQAIDLCASLPAHRATDARIRAIVASDC